MLMQYCYRRVSVCLSFRPSVTSQCCVSTTGRIELVFSVAALFHLSHSVLLGNLGVSKTYSTSLWKCPRLRSWKILPRHVDRVVSETRLRVIFQLDASVLLLCRVTKHYTVVRHCKKTQFHGFAFPRVVWRHRLGEMGLLSPQHFCRNLSKPVNLVGPQILSWRPGGKWLTRKKILLKVVVLRLLHGSSDTASGYR